MTTKPVFRRVRAVGRLTALAVLVALPMMVAAGAMAAARPGVAQQQKVFLKVNTEKLTLVWNGDQGEEGRGRGEVYVSTWVSWPSKVEDKDPQNKEAGPLNGDPEFPSGRIREGPPGTFTIEPASVLDGKFGQIYYNEADCPVKANLIMDVLVWDEDSNKNLEDYQKLITMAADAAATAGVKGAALAGSVVNAILQSLTASSDDALGRNRTKTIPIPDPCAGDFEVTRTIPLENLAKDLWRQAGA